jgi:hypothetical protein
MGTTGQFCLPLPADIISFLDLTAVLLIDTVPIHKHWYDHCTSIYVYNYYHLRLLHTLLLCPLSRMFERRCAGPGSGYAGSGVLRLYAMVLNTTDVRTLAPVTWQWSAVFYYRYTHAVRTRLTTSIMSCSRTA